VPRESLDAPEDLSKPALRQVAFGKLDDEVPRPRQSEADAMVARLLSGSRVTVFPQECDRGGTIFLCRASN
jgi:hypothetical protein